GAGAAPRGTGAGASLVNETFGSQRAGGTPILTGGPAGEVHSATTSGGITGGKVSRTMTVEEHIEVEKPSETVSETLELPTAGYTTDGIGPVAVPPLKSPDHANVSASLSGSDHARPCRRDAAASHRMDGPPDLQVRGRV